MKTLFVNAHVISPDLDLARASVLVENGVVADLLLPGEELPADCPQVDIQGDYLLPGFLDIHTHGCVNYDFCDAAPDGLRKIA